MITKYYDISDLLFVTTDHPLSDQLIPPTRLGSLFTRPTGPSSFPVTPTWQMQAEEHEKRGNAAVKFITDHIATSTWMVNGGVIGEISWDPVLEGITVASTAENQAAITGLLEEIRSQKISAMRLRADWVLLAPGQLDKLCKKAGSQTAAAPEIDRAFLQALRQFRRLNREWNRLIG